MMTVEESNPAVAQENAEQNFSRLIAGVPSSIQQEEASLANDFAQRTDSPLKRLKSLHRAMDRLGAAIAPYCACHRGCAACCHYNVQIFPIEAELIQRETSRRRSNRPPSGRDFHGTPCTFLKDGRCTIYNIRPMACRTHVALTKTAYWCQPERSLKLPFPRATFDGALQALQSIVQSDGRKTIKDIRDFFPD
jgi:Fe-S-cluster containining protein